jgi:hypothetical protein
LASAKIAIPDATRRIVQEITRQLDPPAPELPVVQASRAHTP